MRRKRNRPFTHSRLYGFYKARLLDGTLDRGPRYGSYCITAMGVWAGWGQVAEWRRPLTRGPVVWPPVEPSGLDRIAKFRRSFAHFRVRNIDDVKRAIIAPALVLFSVPITRSWRTASGGVIPIPPDPQAFTEYHAVAGAGYSDTRGHIEFLNSWGPNWGRDGRGYLPYSYFTRYCSDAWFSWPQVSRNWLPKKLGVVADQTIPSFSRATMQQVDDIGDGIFQRLSMFTNPLGNACGVLDFWHSEFDLRIGWSIVTIRDGFPDIEDLFIMPEFWSTDNVRYIVSVIDDMAGREKYPIRLWIAWADTIYNSANFNTVNEVIRALSLTVSPSPHSWAAYVAQRK